LSYLYYENVDNLAFCFVHVAFCVHVFHLGCRKITCSTVNKQIAQQTSTVTVLMSCDDDESDSLAQPIVDEQSPTSPEAPQPVPDVSMSGDDGESDSLAQPIVDEQSPSSLEPLQVPTAFGLRLFYGTKKSKSAKLESVKKSKSTELKPVAVRAHAARSSRKPPRYND